MDIVKENRVIVEHAQRKRHVFAGDAGYSNVSVGNESCFLQYQGESVAVCMGFICGIERHEEQEDQGHSTL